MAHLLWSDIVKGDHVELNGKVWLVAKIKVGGKRAKVTVERGSMRRSAEVKARDAVVKVKPEAAPLRTAGNAQARWATKAESAERQGLPPGDASVTKPPAKPSGDPWETPRDRVERKLDAILGAVLVAEGGPEGYYVPPVDVTTIASHLALMHPNIYDPAKDEATMLAGHEHEHKAAREGRLKLDVNHWHTKSRPEA